MNIVLSNYQGQEFNVNLYFSHEFQGRGGWSINCEVSFKCYKKEFRHYTTDSEFIDQISDMKSDDISFKEIQNKYKEKFFDDLKEIIIEWCEYKSEEE